MMEDTSYWAKYAEGLDGAVAMGGPTLSYQFKNSCMEKYSEIEEITYSLKIQRHMRTHCIFHIQKSIKNVMVII